MPNRKASQRRPTTAPSPVTQKSNMQSPSHPILQMQRAAGNQAVVQMMKKNDVIQRNGDKKGMGGSVGHWGNMFSKFLPSSQSMKKFGMQTLNKVVEEGVSAGFGSDSVDYYNIWKLRKDPEKLDQYMRDRIFRMDGGYQ